MPAAKAKTKKVAKKKSTPIAPAATESKLLPNNQRVVVLTVAFLVLSLVFLYMSYRRSTLL